ncbi:MAG: hypothetical protein QNJ57_13015 [Flavobacteriaceae bacterium]|nr:hypothetical protein [Flavobacteriaceae bacterium]
MRIYLFFLIIISLKINVHSQSSNGDNTVSNRPKLISNSTISPELLRSKFKIRETYEDIQGSPYIENFSGARSNIPLGKIYDTDLNLIGTAFIMYNAYTDEMEISAIEDGVNFYQFKKESNFFYVKLQKKLYRAYVTDYQLGYFIILSDTDKEKCTLLKKEKVLFIKGNKQGVSLVKKEPSSFKRIKDSYFMKLEDMIFKIPNSKKKFFALFKEKSKLVEVYSKRNKLKINSEKDLLSISKYYNSLN